MSQEMNDAFLKGHTHDTYDEKFDSLGGTGNTDHPGSFDLERIRSTALNVGFESCPFSLGLYLT